MDNWTMAQDLQTKSIESGGTAMAQYNRYLEGNESVTKSFTATVNELYTTLISSDGFQTFVKTSSSAIGSITELGKKFGGLGTALTFIIPLMGIKFVNSAKLATIAMIEQQVASGNMANASVGVVQGVKMMATNMLGLTANAEGATIALSGLNMATAGITLGLTLLPILFTTIAGHQRRMREEMDETIKSTSVMVDTANNLTGLIDQYENLTKAGKDTLEVKKQISENLKDGIKGYDEEGNVILKNVDALRDLTEAKKEEALARLENVQALNQEGYEKAKNEIASLNEEIQKTTDVLENGKKRSDGFIETQDGFIYSTEELRNKLLDLYGQVDENKIVLDEYEENEKRIIKLRGEEIAQIDNQSVSLSKLADQTNILEQAQSELNDSNKLSEDTYKEIENIIPNITELRQLDKESLESLIVATLNEKDASINSQIAKNNMMYSSVLGRIKMIMAEIDALEDLSKAEGLAFNSPITGKNTVFLSKNQKSKFIDGSGKILDEQLGQAKKKKKALEEVKGDINKTLNSISSVGSGGYKSTAGGGSKSKKGGSKKDPEKERQKQLKDAYEAQNKELEYQLSLIRNKREEMDNTSKFYQQNLHSENLILKKQHDLNTNFINKGIENRQDLELKSLDIQKEMNSNSEDWWMTLNRQKEKTLEQIDKEIEYSKKKQSIMEEDSQAFKNEQQFQLIALSNKKDVMEGLEESLKNQIYNNKLNGQELEDAQNKLNEIKNGYIDIEKEIKDIGESIKDNIKQEHEKALSQIESQIKKYGKRNEKLKKYAEEEKREIDDQISKLKDKNTELDNQIKKEEMLDNIRKKKQELSNIKAEKNTMLLQGGEWQNVADPQAVRKAEEELLNLQKQYDERERQVSQNNKMQKLEREKAEIDEELQLDIERNQEKIDKMQEFIDEEKLRIDDFTNWKVEDMVEGHDLLRGQEESYYEDSLDKLRDYVKQYNSIHNSLNTSGGTTYSTSSSSGGGGGGGGSSSKSDSDKINDAKKRYDQAKSKGDKAGMDKAHSDAEKVRSKSGYSGGTDGSKRIPKYANGTDYHKGGLALVGYKDTELVNMPEATQVTPAVETSSLLDKLNKLDYMSDFIKNIKPPQIQLPKFNTPSFSGIPTNNSSITQHVEIVMPNVKTENDAYSIPQRLRQIMINKN